MNSVFIGQKIAALEEVFLTEQQKLHAAHAKGRLSDDRYEAWVGRAYDNYQQQVRLYGRMLVDIEMGRVVR